MLRVLLTVTWLKGTKFADDMAGVTLNEDLIRKALLKATPDELDGVLTTIEAYRTCVRTAERLVRKPSMETQRRQVLECASYCEDTLEAYAAGKPMQSIHFPERNLAGAHFSLAIHWS